QVAFEFAPFVHHAGIDDQRGLGRGHVGPCVRIQRGGDGGTGSCPPGWRGWQRAMRRAASQPPRTAPKRAMASIAYSEHVGTKRHRGPSSGLIQRLYRRREPMRKRSITDCANVACLTFFRGLPAMTGQGITARFPASRERGRSARGSEETSEEGRQGREEGHPGEEARCEGGGEEAGGEESRQACGEEAREQARGEKGRAGEEACRQARREEGCACQEARAREKGGTGEEGSAGQEGRAGEG